VLTGELGEALTGELRLALKVSPMCGEGRLGNYTPVAAGFNEVISSAAV